MIKIKVDKKYCYFPCILLIRESCIRDIYVNSIANGEYAMFPSFNKFSSQVKCIEESSQLQCGAGANNDKS